MKRKNYSKEEKEMVKSIRMFKHKQTSEKLIGKSYKRSSSVEQSKAEELNINIAEGKDFSKANSITKKY